MRMIVITYDGNDFDAHYVQAPGPFGFHVEELGLDSNHIINHVIVCEYAQEEDAISVCVDDVGGLVVLPSVYTSAGDSDFVRKSLIDLTIDPLSLHE